MPVEDSKYYSESLMYLPPSYQTSFYDRHMNSSDQLFLIESLQSQYHRNYQYSHSKRTLFSHLFVSKIAGNLNNQIIFCNFNKVDKFDPLTLHVWFNVSNGVTDRYLY